MEPVSATREAVSMKDSFVRLEIGTSFVTAIAFIGALSSLLKKLDLGCFGFEFLVIDELFGSC